MAKKVSEKSLANLIPGQGRPKGVKNKISKDLTQTLRSVWLELQSKKETSLMAQAEGNPKWFYELCRSMFPKELFVSGDMAISQMSPEQIKAEIAELIKNDPELISIVATDSTEE